VGDDPDSCACLMPELGYVVKDDDECNFDSDCKDACKVSIRALSFKLSASSS
jgi:hypothetical protein